MEGKITNIIKLFIHKNSMETIKENGHYISKDHSWIDAFCIIKFDHELGLVVEKVFPENIFTPMDLNGIAMLSFPESNCIDQDDSQTFFFRHRLNIYGHPLKSTDFNKRSYIYGYSYYFQKKDSTNPRGYFQKAFVILTRYYFCTFYHSLAKIIGNAYFANENPDFLHVFFINYYY